VSRFLIAFGGWSWIIWPTFLKNIWKDPRSWDNGATAFFLVHLALTAASLALGTAIGVLGVLGWLRAGSGRPAQVSVVPADRIDGAAVSCEDRPVRSSPSGGSS